MFLNNFLRKNKFIFIKSILIFTIKLIFINEMFFRLEHLLKIKGSFNFFPINS